MGEQKTNTHMTLAEALKEIRKAWGKGVDQGQDLNRTRAAQRIVIASRIKAERTKHNMTQEEISEKINSNALTYKGYENCKSDIPIVYLVRIANVFNVSLDYLTGRTDMDSEKSSQLEERVSKLEEAVFRDQT